MKKKIVWFLPILLFIFLFSSCSSEKPISYDNSIIFSLSIQKSGEICQEISFPSQEDQMSLTQEEHSSYTKELTNKIKLSLFFSYFYNFYNISSTVDANNKLGGENVNYTLPTYDEKEKRIYFSFNFASSEAWDLYHPSSEEKEDNFKIVSGVFINKGISSGNFLFNEQVTIDGEEVLLGEYFYTILSTSSKKYFSGQLEKPDFVYRYCHYSTKIHTNADEKVDNSGQQVNVWRAKYEELGSEKNIEIFTYAVNKWVWYSIALGSTIIGVVIACLVKWLKDNKKRKKENL